MPKKTTQCPRPGLEPNKICNEYFFFERSLFKQPAGIDIFLSCCVFFFQDLFKFFGVRDFLPSDRVIRWLADYVCSEKDLETFCEDIIFVICGFDKKQLNMVSLTFFVENISSFK